MTTRSVLDGRRPPTLVVFDDGVFDVLDERGHDADDLCTTYLGNLVRRWPTLRNLAGMDEGSFATAGPDGTWARSTLSDTQRTMSAASWERGNVARVTDRLDLGSDAAAPTATFHNTRPAADPVVRRELCLGQVQELAEIAELAEHATPGPWYVRSLDDDHAMSLGNPVSLDTGSNQGGSDRSRILTQAFWTKRQERGKNAAFHIPDNVNVRRATRGGVTR